VMTETSPIAGLIMFPRSKEVCHCLARRVLGASSSDGTLRKDIEKILPGLWSAALIANGIMYTCNESRGRNAQRLGDTNHCWHWCHYYVSQSRPGSGGFWHG